MNYRRIALTLIMSLAILPFISCKDAQKKEPGQTGTPPVFKGEIMEIYSEKGHLTGMGGFAKTGESVTKEKEWTFFYDGTKGTKIQAKDFSKTTNRRVPGSITMKAETKREKPCTLTGN